MADDDEAEVKVEFDEAAELKRVQALDGEIKSLLGRSNASGALKAGLAGLPPRGKDEEAKQVAAATMLAVFGALERASIDALIKDLSDDERATVLKYVYKAMSLPADKKVYESLLTWHGKLFAQDGHGIIMRAMLDRKV